MESMSYADEQYPSAPASEETVESSLKPRTITVQIQLEASIAAEWGKYLQLTRWTRRSWLHESILLWLRKMHEDPEVQELERQVREEARLAAASAEAAGLTAIEGFGMEGVEDGGPDASE